MDKIYKFPLKVVGGVQILLLPQSSTILATDDQDNIPTLWCAVDPNLPMQPRYFLLIGTGHTIPENAQYLGTCVGTDFVWHVYEVLEHE
jgi:hypothetical protein